MSPPEPNNPDALSDAQHTVQRKLGRCLIRLQQYESLLKWVVANHDVAGPPDQLQGVRDAKVASVEKLTMGNLVGMLRDGYLTAGEDANAGGTEECVDGVPWLRVRRQIVLKPEAHEVITSAQKELVDLRNELVHHLLQRFNLSKVDECAAAVIYLDASYETIDGHFLTLRGWAQSMHDSRSKMNSFLASPSFRDFLANEFLSYGGDWPTSEVVECLRKAEARFATNGWTKLNTAIEWMREQHPDQQPLHYGCSSWRQVIHESRQFETRKQANESGGNNEVWYRSR